MQARAGKWLSTDGEMQRGQSCSTAQPQQSQACPSTVPSLGRGAVGIPQGMLLLSGKRGWSLPGPCVSPPVPVPVCPPPGL